MSRVREAARSEIASVLPQKKWQDLAKKLKAWERGVAHKEMRQTAGAWNEMVAEGSRGT